MESQEKIMKILKWLGIKNYRVERIPYNFKLDKIVLVNLDNNNTYPVGFEGWEKKNV